MKDLTDQERREILGEVLFDELKAIREYLEYLIPVKPKVDKIDERLESVEQDMGDIKRLLVKHDVTLENHETRLVKLETKRAAL